MSASTTSRSIFRRHMSADFLEDHKHKEEAEIDFFQPHKPIIFVDAKTRVLLCLTEREAMGQAKQHNHPSREMSERVKPLNHFPPRD